MNAIKEKYRKPGEIIRGEAPDWLAFIKNLLCNRDSVILRLAHLTTALRNQVREDSRFTHKEACGFSVAPVPSSAHSRDNNFPICFTSEQENQYLSTWSFKNTR